MLVMSVMYAMVIMSVTVGSPLTNDGLLKTMAFLSLYKRVKFNRSHVSIFLLCACVVV
jgi:hypothetical protein